VNVLFRVSATLHSQIPWFGQCERSGHGSGAVDANTFRPFGEGQLTSEKFLISS
jgi:hypothetical protein